MAECPVLRIELLGGFRVTLGTHAVPDTAWRRSKAAGLVKLLALAPAHRLHREQVMEILWPELAPAVAAANLRKAVYYARHAADADLAVDFITATGDVLSLPSEHVRTDVSAWRTSAAQARRAGDPAVYAAAIELYGDGLLPEDRYEEWTIPHRDELQTEFVALLEELAVLLEARGEIEEVIRAADRLVTIDPLREGGHVLLI
ncbi:MAG TPA: BTAD domain-containing putative transcriptional regulator, partial [Gaiellaceae bacterium]|nr:BTAD domain-containing putative transcriptional regulator [Gaiellaceae bacterium]